MKYLIKTILTISFFSILFIRPSFANFGYPTITESMKTPINYETVIYDLPLIFIREHNTFPYVFCLMSNEDTTPIFRGWFKNSIDYRIALQYTHCKGFYISDGEEWVSFNPTQFSDVELDSGYLPALAIDTSLDVYYRHTVQFPFGSFYNNLGTLNADINYLLANKNLNEQTSSPNTSVEDILEYRYNIEYYSTNSSYMVLDSATIPVLADNPVNTNYYQLLLSTDEYHSYQKSSEGLVDIQQIPPVYIPDYANYPCNNITKLNFDLYNQSGNLVCERYVNAEVEQIKNGIERLLDPLYSSGTEWYDNFWNDLLDLTVVVWGNTIGFFTFDTSTFNGMQLRLRQKIDDKFVLNADFFQSVLDNLEQPVKPDPITVSFDKFGEVELLNFDIIDQNINYVRTFLQFTLTLVLFRMILNTGTLILGRSKTITKS